MLVVILALLLAAAVVGPGLWVRRVMAHYREPADRYRQRGAGGELARHLLDRFELREVPVEAVEMGDHYDPAARVVRLHRDHYHGYSLTAVTVAAHEVGHALQHRDGSILFQWRQQLAGLAQSTEKVGVGVMAVMPLVLALTRAPQAGLAMFIGGLLTLGVGTLVHLLTLPVEWDASFHRAYPILLRGEYLLPGDEAGARRILRAAALTYVASSLMSLLNVMRWLRVLRR